MRPLPAFLLFVAAYLAAIAAGWFPQTATAGELVGHAAKIEAILRLLASGDFAWFPDYLTGSPAATLLSFALSVPVYAPALLLIPDPVVAMKATGLALVALGGLAAFAFGRRLTGDGWSGFAVGCAYLLAPQILQRLGWQEHMTIVTAVPLVPFTFLALLRVAERGTPFDGVLLGVSFSATLLAWSKMGATLALPLAFFAAWQFVARPECRENLRRGALWAVPAVLLLGVVPLLPLLRERGLMTVFALDPFRLWQDLYSAKTATSWFDRAGDLFASMPKQDRMDRGGYYLGLIGFLALALTMFLTWTRRPAGREFAALRFFTLFALGMFWLSFGPDSVVARHFAFLGHAQNFPDIGIPLHWLALAAPGFVLFWCLPPRRWRMGAAVALYALYLFVPAFRLLEWLPLYADLRAPDSFWILNGTFAWAAASALAVVHLLRTRAPASFRPILAAVVLVAAAVDFSAYFGDFYRGGLGADLFAKFRDAGEKLRAGSGRVMAISGRYFYLDLPNRSARPLSTEALNHYLTPTATARLQAAALASATDMVTYLQLAGISDVLVERRDPDVSGAFQKWFRGLLPLKAENESFFILGNPFPLYPGFFAASAVPLPEAPREAANALELAKRHHLAIAAPADVAGENLPGLKSPEIARASSADDFLRLDPAGPRTPSRVALRAPGRAGWVVLDESWHPDWIAAVDGVPAAVYRGAGAFPAVPVRDGSKVVEFRFAPPAWYAGCLAAASLGWIGALGFLLAAPVLPRRFTKPPPPAPASFRSSAPRSPIVRPLALIPTYNEAATLDALLDRILEISPAIEILVIDDASPDGTAARARAHAAHGVRVHVLERAGKLGLGSAYRAGFDWAIERHHDACLQIDADFSHDPADIPRLLAALDAGADAAIGSRYLNGVRVINWPEHRLILSAGASRYVRLLTRLPLTDATSGFKALRVAALRGIDRTQFRADGYGFQIELHWLLWTAGYRLVEVPIVFTERRAGQTKMTLAIAVEAALRVLQLAWRHPSRRPGAPP